VVGVALDVLVVTILAPAGALGKGGATRAMLQAGASTGPLAGLRRVLAGLPSSCFAAVPNGLKYNAAQRAAAFVVRGVQLAVVGAGCGLVGQLGANTAMKLRRREQPEQQGQVAVVPPPLLNTAVVWGVFMGVSANARFQVGSTEPGRALWRRIDGGAGPCGGGMTGPVGGRFYGAVALSPNRLHSLISLPPLPTDPGAAGARARAGGHRAGAETASGGGRRHRHAAVAEQRGGRRALCGDGRGGRAVGRGDGGGRTGMYIHTLYRSWELSTTLDALSCVSPAPLGGSLLETTQPSSLSRE
jgi:hypothetical protein